VFQIAAALLEGVHEVEMRRDGIGRAGAAPNVPKKRERFYQLDIKCSRRPARLYDFQNG